MRAGPTSKRWRYPPPHPPDDCSEPNYKLLVLQSYSDIPLLPPGVDITVRLGNLFERIASINEDLEFSRLRQLRQESQILGEPVCRSCNDFLGGGHRYPGHSKYVRQSTQNQKKASFFP